MFQRNLLLQADISQDWKNWINMLQATNLTKKYGNFTALNALNLTVNEGDIFCLLGANGAGKSTTINLFLNFIDPSEGKAAINGLDVTKKRRKPSVSSPTSRKT